MWGTESPNKLTKLYKQFYYVIKFKYSTYSCKIKKLSAVMMFENKFC